MDGRRLVRRDRSGRRVTAGATEEDATDVEDVHGHTPPDIEAEVDAERRLGHADGVALLTADNLAWLGRLAHGRRTAWYGDATLFAPAGRVEVVPRTLDEAVGQARRLAAGGATELHLDTAGAADLPWAELPRLLRALADALPGVDLVGFCATDVLRWTGAGAPVERVLDGLRDAGLAVLAGDAAERVAEPGGIAWADWERVHRAAHGCGLPTVATIGYRAREPGEAVRLLLALRDLQDATGGLLAAAPVPYPREGDLAGTAPVHALRAVALARLLLDNVPHVAAAPAALGRSTAQLALNFGADALGGPLAHGAAEEGTDDVLELIRDAGLRPVLRDTRYGVVREYPAGPSLAERRAVPQQVWV